MATTPPTTGDETTEALRKRVALLGWRWLLDSDSDEAAGLRELVHAQIPDVAYAFRFASDRPHSSIATFYRFQYQERVQAWLRPDAYERWSPEQAARHLGADPGQTPRLLKAWGVPELPPLPWDDEALGVYPAAAVRLVARWRTEPPGEDEAVAWASPEDGQWATVVHRPKRDGLLAGPESFVWASEDDPDDEHLAAYLPDGWQMHGPSWSEDGRLVMCVRRMADVDREART